MHRTRYRVDLSAHMAECDANYLRVMKLFPALRDEDVSVFGVALGEHPYHVRLTVLERGPYTTLIELRHLPGGPWNLEPRLAVRLYHDAQSAEVVEFHGARHFRPSYAYPNQRMHLPDEKAQVNRFLGEFLSLCLANGITLSALAPAG